MARGQRRTNGLRAPGSGSDEIDKIYVAIGITVTALVLALCMVLLNRANIDVWTGVITFLVLVALAVPSLRWLTRTEGVSDMYHLFLGGFVLKLLMSLVRYFVIFVVYQGAADAGLYNGAGIDFVKRFEAGVPIHPLPSISAFSPEVRRIGDLTGVIYVITGPSVYAGFFIYSAFCFIGQMLFWRGVKAAAPELDQRRYALLILFLPSLLFWPSSIGKEAVMMLCLGLIAYGAGLLLGPKVRVRGALWFALGMGLVLLVRPHLALFSLGAIVLATAVGAAGGGKVGAAGRSVRIIVLLLLLAVGGTISTAVSSSFNDREEGQVELSQGSGPTGSLADLQKTLKQTSIGGSSFSPPAATNPVKIPWAVVSVLLRPFPWEASSITSLISAAEGALLMYLLWQGRRRLLSFPSLALRRPFVVFAATYVFVFSVAFSFIGNFGILARQRTQMLPAALVLLALPVKPKPGHDNEDPTAEVASETATTNLESGRASVVVGRRRLAVSPFPEH